MIPLHGDLSSTQVMDVSIDESMSYPFTVTRSSPQSVPQDVESLSEPADTTISLPPDTLEESIVSSQVDGDGLSMAMPLKLVTEDIPSSSPSPSPNVSPPGHAEALPIQPTIIEVVEKPRKSYDDGVRPLQTFFGASSSRTSQPTSPTNSLLLPNGVSNGLDIPGRTSKADKRRSINPGLPGRPVSGLQSLGSAGLASLQNLALRSDSPDSSHTSYYSPAVSPLPIDRPSSPLIEVLSQVPPSSSRRSSRARSSSTLVPPDTKDDDGSVVVTTAVPLVPFPPRGNSLPLHQLHGRDYHASDNYRQQSDPSFLTVAASDEGYKTPRLSSELSLPPVKDDRLRTPSPASDRGDDDTEMTPQKAHLQAETPVLPSARFSKHTPGLTDILTSVSESQPKVPMPGAYGIRSGLSLPNGDVKSDDSQSVTSSLSPSQGTPTIVHHSADSSDEVESLQLFSSPIQLHPSTHLHVNGNAREGGLPQSASHPPTQLSSSTRSGSSEPVPTSSSHPSGSSSLHLTAPIPSLLHPSPRKTSMSGGGLAALGASMVNGSATSLVGSSKSSATHHDGGSSSSSSADVKKLREVLNEANERGAASVKLDYEFVESILRSVEGTREAYSGLKGDMDHVKVDYFHTRNRDFNIDRCVQRTSHQYMTGFSVAQEEYQKEVAARKDLQAEITRLRVQLSGQAARLTAMSAEARSQATLEKLVLDLNGHIAGIAQEVARIRVERDMGLAELDEIAATKK